jgi:hypothetical protein
MDLPIDKRLADTKQSKTKERLGGRAGAGADTEGAVSMCGDLVQNV